MEKTYAPIIQLLPLGSTAKNCPGTIRLTISYWHCQEWMSSPATGLSENLLEQTLKVWCWSDDKFNNW